jgi:TRAP-type C4-dicarboxylate transport system substrate-binding protein
MIGRTVRFASLLAGTLLLLHPAAMRAQTVWDMPTEYPANAMPGVGLTAFAKHLTELSAGKITIKPSFDAASGIKSAAMLAAIADGQVQAGDAFAGSLEAEDRSLLCPRCRFW